MTRARELSKLGNPYVFTVDSSNNLGIGSLTPDAKLDVTGIVSATSFSGSGANLSGITAGAILSAGSGAQRVVATSLTTGAMTTVAPLAIVPLATKLTTPDSTPSRFYPSP